MGALRRQVSKFYRVDIMDGYVMGHPEKIKNMHMEFMKVNIFKKNKIYMAKSSIYRLINTVDP